MLGIVMPVSDLMKFVMMHERPSSWIHAYAPMNGADMEHRISARMRLFRISYRL
jgi:hypothetical protein